MKAFELKCGDCGYINNVDYEDLINIHNVDLLPRKTLFDKYRNAALIRLSNNENFNDENDIIIKTKEMKEKLRLFLINSNLSDEQKRELLTLLKF